MSAINIFVQKFYSCYRDSTEGGRDMRSLVYACASFSECVGAHAQQGYSSQFVCVCVCVCCYRANVLFHRSFTDPRQGSYHRLLYDDFLDFDSQISLCSRDMLTTAVADLGGGGGGFWGCNPPPPPLSNAPSPHLQYAVLLYCLVGKCT